MNDRTHPRLCAASAPRPGINNPDHIVTIGCVLPAGHEVLHFDPVQGDWADGDTQMRPYSARAHLLRRLSRAPMAGGMAQDEELLDAYRREVAHQLAEEIRAATREGGSGEHWNWWDSAAIATSCADLIDPEAQQ